MTNEQEAGDLIPPGCGFYFTWLLVSIVGMGLGWAAGWRISFITPGLISTAVLGLIVGAILGFMQWLVLRRQIQGSGWWVLATVLGWVGGFSLGVLFAQQLGLTEVWFGLLVGAVTGALLGIFQWLVIRSQVTKAGWWLPASVFAWTSSLLYYQPGVSALGALYGILSGLVTGIALLWLLYRPEP